MHQRVHSQICTMRQCLSHYPICPLNPICTVWYTGIPWDVLYVPPLTHTVVHVSPISSVPCGKLGSHCPLCTVWYTGILWDVLRVPTLSYISVPSHLYHVVHWDPMGCTMGTTTDPHCPTYPICTMWYTGIPWDVPWVPPLTHTVPHVHPIPSHLYHVVQWDPMGCTMGTTTDPHCPTCPSHPICTMWYTGIPWHVPWVPPLTHTVPHAHPIPSVPCGTLGSHGMYHGHHH